MKCPLFYQNHKSSYSKQLVEKSIEYLENSNKNVEGIQKHPCRLVVVDASFVHPLTNACKNLVKDGLNMEQDKSMIRAETSNVQVTPGTGLGKAIEVVRVTMKNLNHALYEKHIYTKAKKGKKEIFLLFK